MTAVTEETQVVVDDGKSGLAFHPAFDLVQQVLPELLNATAIEADQMMMIVEVSFAVQLETGLSAHFQSGDHSEVLEKLEGAVNGSKTDIGLANAGLLVDFLGRKMVVASGGQHLEHDLPLRREPLVTGLYRPPDFCQPVIQ